MRRRLLLLAQIALAGAVLWLAWGSIVRQWNAARAEGFGLALNWPLALLSAALVLAAYAVLIQAWRVTMAGWSPAARRLGSADAARIWFVSNLGRYVPGKIWQIGAMGVMAQRAGVPAVAATGSAILVNLVNLLAGVGVVALTGASLLRNPALVVGAAALLGAAILGAPRVLPLLLRAAERLAGRPIPVPAIPQRAIWLATAASAIAWVVYGIAFRLFAESVAPAAAGPVTSYMAVFTASYLIGYVMLFAPGGLVVREAALVAFLEQLNLAAGGAGVLIAVASRLWLTVLEVLPGAIFLVLGTRRASTRSPSTE